jgi:hypothetical protein
MSACYLIFSSLFPLAQPLESIIGEFADVLGMTAFLWPYPVFLALQTWLAESLWLWLLSLVVGLGLVVAFAALLRESPAFLEPAWWTRLSAAVLWYVPLLVSQATLVVIIWSLGYPVGE